MVFVDTSVWISFFRGQNKIVQTLSELLDDRQVALAAAVWLELLNGTKKSEFATLARVLAAVPRFTPSGETWKICEHWIELSISRGKKFAVPDLLIAATCAQYKGVIWSLDKDFHQMHLLGFVDMLSNAEA